MVSGDEGNDQASLFSCKASRPNAPLSFLDQIKKSSKDLSSGETTAPPMNLMAAIKSRRKE